MSLAPSVVVARRIAYAAALIVSVFANGTASAADVALARAPELLGETGTWQCKWEPAEDGLTIRITRSNANMLRLELAFAGGRAREIETMRYDAHRRTWAVHGDVTGAKAAGYAYDLRDADNPADDAEGLYFEGHARRTRDGKPYGSPLVIRDTVYLSGDEFYYWRHWKNGTTWVPQGRRACGRSGVPSI